MKQKDPIAPMINKIINLKAKINNLSKEIPKAFMPPSKDKVYEFGTHRYHYVYVANGSEFGGQLLIKDIETGLHFFVEYCDDEKFGLGFSQPAFLNPTEK